MRDESDAAHLTKEREFNNVPKQHGAKSLDQRNEPLRAKRTNLFLNSLICEDLKLKLKLMILNVSPKGFIPLVQAFSPMLFGLITHHPSRIIRGFATSGSSRNTQYAIRNTQYAIRII